MEEHHLSGPEHKLERLIFFSDAVFAIAITLLVIELRPPRLHFGASEQDHVVALGQLFPNLLGFTTSFFVIGAFWAGHHRAFAYARRWSDTLVTPNLLLLFAVAAMPFVTAYMSANATAHVPVALYCIWLIVTGLLNHHLQRIALAPPVVDPSAPAPAVREVRRRGLSVVLGAACALALSLVIPRPFTGMGLMALMTIGPWRAWLTGAPRHG